MEPERDRPTPGDVREPERVRICHEIDTGQEQVHESKERDMGSEQHLPEQRRGPAIHARPIVYRGCRVNLLEGRIRPQVRIGGAHGEVDDVEERRGACGERGSKLRFVPLASGSRIEVESPASVHRGIQYVSCSEPSNTTGNLLDPD
jgi:hypothetical protein